jgi:DNA-binding transcriptional regulator of glucitol operon
VYSEDMKLLMDAGKEMPAEPAIVTALSDTGRWNEGPFRQMFIDRRIALVVVYEDLSNPQRFTSGVRDAIETNYQPTRISEDFTVYRPKDRHDSQ